MKLKMSREQRKEALDDLLPYLEEKMIRMWEPYSEDSDVPFEYMCAVAQSLIALYLRERLKLAD